MSREVAAWQAPLLEALRGPDGVAAAAQRLRWRGTDLDALVVGDARRDALGRVGEYARMYGARLIEALAAHYPKLHDALGDAGFERLAQAYLHDCPSRDPSLRALGALLPAWLSVCTVRQGFDDVRLPWFVDLARLEAARTDVFDAADDPILTLADLRALAPEALADLPLRTVRAHRLVTVSHDVDELWGSPADRVPGRAPGTLLVWRRGVAAFHRRVPPLEERALALLATAPTFALFCEALVTSERTLPEIARLVERWVRDELIAA